MRTAPLPRSWFGAVPMVLVAVLSLISAELGAQESEDPITLALRAESGTVDLQIGDILGIGGIHRSLEAGLPVRIAIVTELWRDRLLDSQVARHDWRATVRYDPLSELYRLETADGVVGQSSSLEQITRFLREEVSVPIGPTSAGTYYYLARIELETLSLSDVEELRRWLRGELTPAVEGGGEVGGALGQGLRRLVVRMLGLPVQRYQVRSARFEWQGS